MHISNERLARDIDTLRVDQLWVTDLTYVRLQEEFIFPVILDACPRRVIGSASPCAGSEQVRGQRRRTLLVELLLVLVDYSALMCILPLVVVVRSQVSVDIRSLEENSNARAQRNARRSPPQLSSPYTGCFLPSAPSRNARCNRNRSCCTGCRR